MLFDQSTYYNNTGNILLKIIVKSLAYINFYHISYLEI